MIKQDIEKTYIIIPAYNEASVITTVVNTVMKHFNNVIIVDDASTDKTAHLALEAGAIVLHHEINLGQGAALQTGFDYVTQKTSDCYIVTFDADDQHRIDDAIELLTILKQTNADIVLGSRFTGQAINIPSSRRILLKLCSYYTQRILKIQLTDCHNGLRVMTGKTASKLCLQQNGMAHASEIIDKISRLNLKYAEAPVVINYTEYSKSKGQSFWNGFFIVRNLLLQRIIN